MYSLSIFFGPSPVPAQFLFKDKEKAEAALKTSDGLNQLRMGIPNAVNVNIEIVDDYGQRGSFLSSSIHAVILEDMDLGEESRIQRGLSQARGQAKANERARTDPILIKAATQGRGPSMITPFSAGGGGFNG